MEFQNRKKNKIIFVKWKFQIKQKLRKKSEISYKFPNRWKKGNLGITCDQFINLIKIFVTKQ